MKGSVARMALAGARREMRASLKAQLESLFVESCSLFCEPLGEGGHEVLGDVG